MDVKISLCYLFVACGYHKFSPPDRKQLRRSSVTTDQNELWNRVEDTGSSHGLTVRSSTFLLHNNEKLKKIQLGAHKNLTTRSKFHGNPAPPATTGVECCVYFVLYLKCMQLCKHVSEQHILGTRILHPMHFY
jgi:hypothetical protein